MSIEQTDLEVRALSLVPAARNLAGMDVEPGPASLQGLVLDRDVRPQG